MEKRKLWMVILFFAVGTCATVSADEVADLKKELARAHEMLLKMQARITRLETQQKAQDKRIAETVAKTVEKRAAAAPATVSWLDRWKLSGDFRYRNEMIEEENNDNRQRNLIRARLMLEALINDEWDFGLRIATGSGDPVSTNQTLDSSFSSKDLFLDLAYVHYHPAWMDNLDVFAGKVKNPFYAVGKTQLIWDVDLNPEGGAVKLKSKLGKYDTLFTNAGGFWVDESSGGADTSLFGVQSYIKHAFDNGDYLLAGASYFNYGNIKGRGDLGSTWGDADFFGNTSSGGLFASDYDLFEAFGEYGFKVGGAPITVFGDYVKNVAASTSEDTGWLLGGKIGKAREIGSYEFAYNYRDLEADAVLGAFSDSDFLGGGTNGKGHKFGFTYQLARNLQAKLSYYLAEKTRTSGRDDDYRRLQIDFKYKF